MLLNLIVHNSLPVNCHVPRHFYRFNLDENDVVTSLIKKKLFIFCYKTSATNESIVMLIAEIIEKVELADFETAIHHSGKFTCLIIRVIIIIIIILLLILFVINFIILLIIINFYR